MSDSDTLAEIRAIVSDPEMRRTRYRRDALTQIRALVDSAPAVDDEEQAKEAGETEGDKSSVAKRARGPRMAKEADETEGE